MTGFTPYFVNFEREIELYPKRDASIGDELEFEQNWDQENHPAKHDVYHLGDTIPPTTSL